mmetsp:Transcript_72871/g.202127  ORF Transcript_72871/g.202127 Transcript_72871/m.202127 type:complete len:307 (-) Transcript_72871:157-1077(-)
MAASAVHAPIAGKKDFQDASVLLASRPAPAAAAPTGLELGLVSLVGAGPGDPELLTLKALRRLEAAEVVLHDSLISAEVMMLIPTTAEVVNVGKRCGDPKDRGLQQQEIHELLVAHSRRGRKVVRLKCGDPLVFGRGGEELEFLAQHGVPTEVVPGITTALGASASCQMPLTHRGCANQVRFVVGQTKARELPELGWDELAREANKETVVFYMGLKSLEGICERLRKHGAPSDTPMAIVENATLPGERAVYGTIESIASLAKKAEAGLNGPVIVFLGPTAAFPSKLEELAGSRPRKIARVSSPSEC